MTIKPAGVLFAVSLALLLSVDSVWSRNLTFEDRVRAQESIERVYYSHQEGARRPFEEAVPRDVLERKVRTYLKQSVALDTFWSTPVTAEMLDKEVGRMSRQTRMPERLRQLFAALGSDPLLIRECLARPALVGRLVRAFFAHDRIMHAEARRLAEHVHDQLASGRIDPRSEHPNRKVLSLKRVDRRAHDRRSGLEGRTFVDSNAWRLELPSEEFEDWNERLPGPIGAIGALVEEREAFVVRIVLERAPDELRFANFVVEKQAWGDWWRSVEAALDETMVPTAASADSDRGADRFSLASTCVADDTWDNGSLGDVPAPRVSQTAVWTGSLMVVWGGLNVGNTGARYDPATDTWIQTSTVNAPSARHFHSAVWTGSAMIVWGGWDGYPGPGFDTGGRYDPMTDTWTPTSTANAPSGRFRHTAVWTGDTMLIWGGASTSTSNLNTGGRYDPITDSWAPMSTSNAPSGRASHTAVWTGSRMIVWGGALVFSSELSPDLGGQYDPASDAWTATSVANAPAPRADHTAVWTGSLMIIWGGWGASGFLGTGGRYDPGNDSWTPTSAAGAPLSRYGHTAVWSGDSMIVWGGRTSQCPTSSSGARYDPSSDTWTATSETNAPLARIDHSAVWTGSLMIVWGGKGDTSRCRSFLPILTNTGGRYDPTQDTWTPTSTGNGPSGRYGHTAVWTGSHMVVWGGTDGFAFYPRVGGRYDPALDAWEATSATNAPAGCVGHMAVWTGQVMVIWCGGGRGGRYDPIADAWMPVSTLNAPPGNVPAIWTGTVMVVWAGDCPTCGRRYDPVTDVWSPISMTNAPLPRAGFSAVWSGTHMIVWGGSSHCAPDCTLHNTGGRYHPATDTWMPTSTTNAPSAREFHTAVWADDRMVVWGGGYGSNTGGRYDPLTDTWTPTSTTNAPSGRDVPTAVWTGDRMVVWGGYEASNTGGRYDPVADAWTPTSTANAPAARYYHTAVWTGSFMIIWDGVGGTSTGGRYALAQSVDDDGDGYSECAGDCDDTRAAVRPGAVEICNGLDDNCAGGIDEDGAALCADADACTLDSCQGASGCVHDPAADGSSCEDRNSCTTIDTCQGGICAGGGPRDADGDAHPDALCGGDDCDDADPQVWSPPIEVGGLVVTTGSPTQVAWDGQDGVAGPGTVYDLVSGSVSGPAQFDFTAASCLQTGGATSHGDARADPVVGGLYWYLARGRNTCGAGTYGTSQRDSTIPPCP